MAINVVKIKQLFFSSSVIMAHFGKNPVSGGSPPKDKRINGIIVSIVGVLFHNNEIELIVVDELSISIMNMGIVNTM